MPARIVSSAQMGLNCWSAARLAGSCASCARYDSCRYPERVADQTYDTLRDEARRLKERSEELYRQAGQIARR